MTQSRRDVGVRGRLARSGPRRLDRAWLGQGRGSTWVVHGSTRSVRGDRTGARGDGSVGCAPLARSVIDWLVRLVDQWVHHLR
jgi:hypothetical protein